MKIINLQKVFYLPIIEEVYLSFLAYLRGMIFFKKITSSILFTFTLVVISQTVLWSQSNEGVDFWFGFMEHRDVGTNSKVAMITSKFNTSGEISVPNRNWSQNFSVAANQVVVVQLPDYTENIGSESIDQVGVHLTSQQPVSVYIHQYQNFRSEATVVLPTSSLGKEYYTLSYQGVVNRGTIYPSEFLIVGTQDETIITINLGDNTKNGRPGGTSFEIVLNAGETYQVQSAQGPSEDLSGTKIVGDKKFAVFSGNSWTEIPTGCFARDNLLEQMLPISTWGKQFVAVPLAKMNYNVFRVMASENNTEIELKGVTGTLSYNLDAGEFTQFNLSSAAFIVGDKPIQVAQYNPGLDCGGYPFGDPSMVMLNSVEQTRDTVTLFNSSLQDIKENYINIIATSDDFPLVTLDGQSIPASAEVGTVGTDNEYTYAKVQVTNGAHTIVSQGCGVIVSAYGFGDVESYAYSGGASFNPINGNPIPEGGCLNDTIFFDAQLPESRYSFFWDLGDGNTTTEAKFEHKYPSLGTYPVELIITDECQGTVDTLNRDLLVSLRKAVESEGDQLLCEGESFDLGATDLAGARYEWIGPNNYFSEEQFPFVRNAATFQSGTYEVIGIVSGCATFPSYTEVTVFPNPQPFLGPDTIFCNYDFQTTLDPGEFMSYRWQDNSPQSEFDVNDEGKFWVEVTDENGCRGVDSVELRQVCPTRIYIPNAFSPNYDGYNDQFQVYGNDVISMRLRIFDRWGNFLFEGNSQEEYWDGKFKGRDMRNGTYVWTLEVEGYRANGNTYREVLSGDLILLR